MRGTEEIEAGSKQRNCTGTLDVLNWLSTIVNDNRNGKGCLMVAYGGLIHTLRERDFVDKSGKYLDDDIDSKANIVSFIILVPLMHTHHC
jgi:hypothetical protein